MNDFRTSFRIAVLAGVIICPLLIGIAPNPSRAVSSNDDRVSELIVRYENDDLAARDGEVAWGVHCLPNKYRARLHLDHGLGAQMWAVTVEPALRPKEAKAVLDRLNTCKGILWAEIDHVVFEPSY